jgi:hypothetical protein
MKTFPVSELITLLITLGLSGYILYLSVSLFHKIQTKVETIKELDSLRTSLFIVLAFSIITIIISSFVLYSTKKKGESKEKLNILIALMVIDLVGLALTSTYIVILQKLENFYKAKNYDKSTENAKILIGLDSSSILLSFVSIGLMFKDFYLK